jgi:23S rRNA (cytosine1962-C5)-methyltransferase
MSYVLRWTYYVVRITSYVDVIRPLITMPPLPLTWYQLLDSGAGEKLERFGTKTLIRPSSLAIWDRRLSKQEWQKADATLIPKSAWRFSGKNFEEWEVQGEPFSFLLRLQTNGQVGIFPEHSSYLSSMSDFLVASPKKRVLNLFAYTGLASVSALKSGSLQKSARLGACEY